MLLYYLPQGEENTLVLISLNNTLLYGTLHDEVSFLLLRILWLIIVNYSRVKKYSLTILFN